ncbi:MAG: HDOD domain-containing protein [Planctomycetes bacterium]|nr:HDOD domain-containing protein [Planctomycetota bacterium]
MSKETLLAQITNNPRLPTPPSVALQVADRASKPHCTIAEIGRIISHDPSLCARLLKMVNSALFALPRAVTSIERALNLLGLKRVRSLVLSLSLPAMQVRSKSNPRMRDYWKSSVASAIITRELASRMNNPDPDSEMVAGLLSDLGTLILQEVYPDQCMQIMAFPPEVLVNSQCELEEKMLGINHAEVSAYILQRWRLPEEITQPILFHHHPTKAPLAFSERTYLLYFANRLAQLQLTVGQSVMLGEIVSLALERYGMDDARFREFLDPLAKKIEEFASLLQVDIGACQQFPTLFASATENLTRLAVETSMDNIRAQEEQKRTEKKLQKTEEALHITEEKLRQSMKMEAIGRLAGGVAHDFNNLLTVINGYAELLSTMLPAEQQTHTFAEEIKRAGGRASELTRQLLAFSRKQILVPEVLNLNDTVSSMDKMLRRVIGEDIELVTALASSLPLVKVDPGQVDQVIMNLAVNARDAMPAGGKLTLETGTADLDENYVAPHADLKAGAYVYMALSDTGTGMTDEVKKSLFEPFFSTKGGQGTGLGLATVHGIVKQSGGHISVYSEVGLGTSFKVYFPVALEPKSEPKPPPASVDMIPQGSETILLTEDEEGVRRIAQRTLEMYGYKILEARDGFEALKVSEEFKGSIDILVTDTIMPQMGGCELAQRLSRQRPNLKVLYTSGYTDEAIIRHGILSSGLPFLQKPFSPAVLACKIREVLKPRAI